MFLLSLALLALLATSGVQSGKKRKMHNIYCMLCLISLHLITFTGSPHYTGGNENLQSQATEEQSLDSEEDYWPDAELELVYPVSLEYKNVLTTPESYVVTEQGG